MRSPRAIACATATTIGVLAALAPPAGAADHKEAPLVPEDVASLKFRATGDQVVPGPGHQTARARGRLRVGSGNLCVALAYTRNGDDRPTSVIIGRGGAGDVGESVASIIVGSGPGAGPHVRGCTPVGSATLSSLREDPAGHYVQVNSALFGDGSVRGVLRHPGHRRSASR